jgi:hypothetical protein
MIELEIKAFDDKPVEMVLNFEGEFVSGADGGEYERGFEDGKNSVVQLERYLKGNPQIVGLGGFKSSEVELNFENLTSFNSFCYCQNEQYKNTIVEKLVIKCSNTVVENLSQMLRCSNSCVDMVLKKVTLNFSTQYATNFFQSFGNCQAIETIDGVPFDFSSSTTTTIQPFVNCYALKEFEVVKNTIEKSFLIAQSPNLSTDTIQSIIDGLADLTGGTAQTVDFHADVVAKLTAEQITQIYYKNWSVS